MCNDSIEVLPVFSEWALKRDDVACATVGEWLPICDTVKTSALENQTPALLYGVAITGIFQKKKIAHLMSYM